MKILKFITLLSLLFLFNNSLASETTVEMVKGSAVYVGDVYGPKECKGEEIQVFFSHKNLVNYQIPVPSKGNFQVHLVPGHYNIVAIDEGGCFAEAQLKVEEDKLYREEIRLEKISEVSWFNIVDFLIPEAVASSGYCIHCLQGYNRGQSPFGGPMMGGYPQTRFGYPTPHWGPFGHFSYNRFNSPCPMGGLYPGAYAILEKQQEKKFGEPNRAPASTIGYGPPTDLMRHQREMFGPGFRPPGMMPHRPMGPGFSAGCMSNRYPGGGGIVAGKPNIYFHAPQGTEIELKIKQQENGNFLATTPVLPKQGIRFQAGDNGSLLMGGAKYPYFFYDIRTDSDYMQERYGQCVAGRDVVTTMVKYLKDAGFNQKEQKDFYSYWNVKLPKMPKVCIYPQINENLEKLATLEISPRPDRVIRVVFMLVPIIKGKQPRGYFSKMPEKDWNFQKMFKARELASSKKDFVVREWGVGFLTIPEMPKDKPQNQIKEVSVPIK
jgi:hypothetical protein